MRSSRDPFAVVALVGAGTLVGHELGYLAGTSADTGHGYFALIAPLAIVGVVLAFWASAVSVVRRGAGRIPSVACLAAAQVLLYTIFEVGERAVGATELPLFSLPVLLGLVAQPIVAWAAVSVLRLTTAVLSAFVDTPLRIDSVSVVARRRFTPSQPVLVLLGPAAARAPPLWF